MADPTFEHVQNSILRISYKKTMELIREYRKEECLWNTSLDDYPNKTKRVAAANKIAKKLNIKDFEGKHVMMKFKNLRNSYSQELKKMAFSMNTYGPDSPRLYKPKVHWFPLLDSFIRPHLKTYQPVMMRKRKSNANPECSDTDAQEDCAIPSKLELESANSNSEASYSLSDYPSENENDEKPSDFPAKRSRKSSSNHSEKYNQNQVFLPSDVVNPVLSTNEDTFDNFGKYIASLLRNLPPNKALMLQPRIVNMIVEVGISEQSTSNTIQVKIEQNQED